MTIRKFTLVLSPLSLVVNVIALICIIPTTIHLITSDKKKKIKFTRIDTLSSILCIIFYLTWSIHYTIISIYGILYNNTPQFTPYACIAKWLINFWLLFARFSCAIFFISRLYKTFKGSAFAISKRALKTTIIILVILSIIVATLIYIFCKLFLIPCQTTRMYK